MCLAFCPKNSFIYTIVYFLLGVLVVGPANNAFANPKSIEKKVVQAVETEASAQGKLDEWSIQRDALLDEARNLRLEMQWLELQEERLQRHTKSAAEKIEKLQQAQSSYAVISLKLEQDLIEDLARLETVIKEDFPFLTEERNNRINFLRESINDPEMNIGEKYRRFMEAMQAEADYGEKLETSMQAVQFNGQLSDIITIKAGRLGYYCLTFDRAKAGIWSFSKQAFVPLGEPALQAVRSLEAMATSKQHNNLVMLPVQEN